MRVDLTKDKRYSISSATKDIIENLEEPLIIKGYFSKKTHPSFISTSSTIKRFNKRIQGCRKRKNRNRAYRPYR
ncbi:MAG: DUF7088 domain-containing protein [Bdellovibrionota bacterium]